jgi:hypothetical protein
MSRIVITIGLATSFIGALVLGALWPLERRRLARWFAVEAEGEKSTKRRLFRTGWFLVAAGQALQIVGVWLT